MGQTLIEKNSRKKLHLSIGPAEERLPAPFEGPRCLAKGECLVPRGKRSVWFGSFVSGLEVFVSKPEPLQNLGQHGCLNNLE